MDLTVCPESSYYYYYYYYDYYYPTYTVVGQRSAGNGPNGLSYDYCYYYCDKNVKVFS